MKVLSVSGILRGLVLLVCVVAGVGSVGDAQTAQLDEQVVIRGIDAAVKARLDATLGYTVTEHYRVFRGGDETNPAAEMTVKTTYRKESGKEYAIKSRSVRRRFRSLFLTRFWRTRSTSTNLGCGRDRG
jgi:hypothetical protein